VQEQHYLAKNGISILESNCMCLFEREAHVNLIIKAFKEEMDALKRQQNYRR
jgi:hypothetical protein